jgi:hypothetical protein
MNDSFVILLQENAVQLLFSGVNPERVTSRFSLVSLRAIIISIIFTKA